MTSYYIKLYFITLAAFLAIDMVWLGLVARGFYRKNLGFLMLAKPNWIAAIIFYLLFIVGLLIFVIVPGLNANSLLKTLLLAAFFGLVTYTTYDLTNLATIKKWPFIVTVVDMLWGAVLSVLVSLVGFKIGKLLE
jgi:uncharacterized membrane protein